LAGLGVDFIDDTGAFLDAKAFSIAAYGDRTPPADSTGKVTTARLAPYRLHIVSER